MRRDVLKILITAALLFIVHSGYSQEAGDANRVKEILDSLKAAGVILDGHQKEKHVTLTTDQAVGFLREMNQAKYWKDPGDPLRSAIEQLVFRASHVPYDTAAVFLKKYPLDSLGVPWDKFYIWEPLRFRIPEVSAPVPVFRNDTLAMQDSLFKAFNQDTLKQKELALPTLGLRYKTAARLKDTAILVVVDTLHQVTSGYSGFPFAYYSYPYQADSLKAAVDKLLQYLEERDSLKIYVTGTGKSVTPIWLNSKSPMIHRYWLRNDMDDSVTVWIGAPSRNTVGLYLEQGVSFRRPVKQGVNTAARVDIQEVDRSKLLEVQKIAIKKQYWKYRSEASFALNQAALSNWVKGGESSVSVSTDITGYADYNNADKKITSNNFARLKYGLLKSGDNGVRKNLDLLETNSKLNHKAFGKFDFSAIMLFKTQLTSGYTYPTDTTRVLASKFFNPATLTIGLGLDYKPNKSTSINFSPLSYKGTFVTDTTGTIGVNAIDPSKYGIPKGKKALNEPGVSFMISNEYKPLKTLSVTNRLQLFTNYIHNPQNVDVDWEMILTANLNWFTDVRFNTHLIFDDDTRTPVFDKEKKPVLGPDGKQKSTARIQFKELLGFSFVFRF